MSAAPHVRPTRTPNRPRLLFAMFALFGVVARPQDTAPPARNEHWAFKPAVRTAVPAAKNRAWPRNPIDQFVLAKLEAEKLTPSTEADRVTLIRRLSFDLIGLPPTAEEVQQFVSDKNPDAYEKIVDRLLSSPRYGERWARHWLDVVHFGETHGYDKDQPRPNAWPYRDYVIRSFNEDKKYVRFVQEQLAGDVLYPFSRDGFEALGFIAAGPWDLIGHAEVPESKIDGKVARHLDRDDMVANTIQTFNSLTVQCAQCHNHKFDPISQEDYYSLQAVFAAVDRTNLKYDTDPAVAKLRAALQQQQQSLAAVKQGIEETIRARAGQPLTDLDRKVASSEEEEALLPQVECALADVNGELGRLPPQRVAYVGAVHHGAGAFRGTGPEGGKPRPIHLLP